MFRNDTVEMTTKQYADYITKLTWKRKTANSVANDCRNGKLNCYQDVDGGGWHIIVKRTVVPLSEYEELLKKYNGAMNAITSIRKLIEEKRA